MLHSGSVSDSNPRGWDRPGARPNAVSPSAKREWYCWRVLPKMNDIKLCIMIDIRLRKFKVRATRIINWLCIKFLYFMVDFANCYFFSRKCTGSWKYLPVYLDLLCDFTQIYVRLGFHPDLISSHVGSWISGCATLGCDWPQILSRDVYASSASSATRGPIIGCQFERSPSALFRHIFVRLSRD